MKKRLMSLSLAVLMVFAMMTTSALAAGASYSKTVNLGLALDAGASGWFEPVSTSILAPTNGIVDTVTINPGTATINAGNKNFLGVALPSILRITAPNGTYADIAWNSKGMTTSAFQGFPARGTWTLQLYGTNLTKPTGDYMSDLLRFGSVSYKNLQITVTCQ